MLGYDRIRRRHGQNDEQLNQLVAEYRHGGILINPVEAVKAVDDDPDDDRILECAVSGNADFIISGDPHLLRLQSFHDIRILTPREFMLVLIAGEPAQ